VVGSATVGVALLVLAGVAAGVTGSMAGLASLFSYPALLAVGLSPVVANQTNTIALAVSSVGAIVSSRPELRGQGPRVLRLLPLTILGGAIGAGLLVGNYTGPAIARRLPPNVLRVGIALAGFLLAAILLRRALTGAG
jgi:uncharacterized membrane protein YfcA